LEECAVPFESVTVDLQNKPKEFVDLYAVSNPLPGARAKVPLLEVTDGTDRAVLCESLIVTEYISERYGGGALLPPRFEDRARAKLFTELCATSFSYWSIIRAKGEAREAAIETYRQELTGIDIFLSRVGEGSGPFLLGDRFSIAECNAAPFVQRACAILPSFTGKGEMGNGEGKSVDLLEICDELKLVRLKMWIEAVLARPSVVHTGVSREDMVKSTTLMLKRFASTEVKK